MMGNREEGKKTARQGKVFCTGQKNSSSTVIEPWKALEISQSAHGLAGGPAKHGPFPEKMPPRKAGETGTGGETRDEPLCNYSSGHLTQNFFFCVFFLFSLVYESAVIAIPVLEITLSVSQFQCGGEASCCGQGPVIPVIPICFSARRSLFTIRAGLTGVTFRSRSPAMEPCPRQSGKRWRINRSPEVSSAVGPSPQSIVLSAAFQLETIQGGDCVTVVLGPVNGDCGLLPATKEY